MTNAAKASGTKNNAYRQPRMILPQDIRQVFNEIAPPNSESLALRGRLAGSQLGNGPSVTADQHTPGPEFTLRNPGECLLLGGGPGRPGSASRSRSRVLHEAHAIAVRADFGVARIQLAAVHVVVIVRLVLVGNEIDALAALLVAVRAFLKLQGLPDRRVLRRKSFAQTIRPAARPRAPSCRS